MATATPATAHADRWAVLALAIAARTATAVQFQSVGAMGPALLADSTLGIAYGGLGALIGAYMLPGIVLALPAGWMTARHGERRIALAGLALVAVGGVVIAMAGGMATALAGRAVSGAGGALLMVVMTTVVTERFSGSAELVMALGAMLAAWPLGVALALVVLPSLAEITSWRSSMLVVSLAAGLAFAAGVMVLKPPRRAEPPSADARRAQSGLLGLRGGELGAVITSGIAWIGQNVAFAVLLGFVPALLTERGMSAATAGLLGSLAGWSRIPILPFGGALADRTGRPLLAASLLHVAAGAAVLVLVTDSTLPAAAAGAAIMAAGLLSTPPGPVIMSLPARALSPETRAVGMGVYYTLFYAGMAAFPPLAGLARDITGFAAAPLVVAALFHGVAVAGIAAYAMHAKRLQPERTIP